MKSQLILTLIVLTLFSLDISAQASNSAQPQKKIALVIGNGNYTSSVLANPENDAKAMKVALQNVGFTVLEYENLNQVQMKKAIDDFGDKLKSYEVGLFYYAGHGIQSKGYNYLIPVDAELTTERQVEYDCVQADRVLALMEGSGTKLNILILDACRNNPFERSWTRSANGSGLAFMNAPKGTLIAYATSPGSTASDGSGKNGLYTSAIIESISIPNITIIQMFQQVRSIVSHESGDKQIPWESTSLTGDFYFNNPGTFVSQLHEKTEVTPVIETSQTNEIEYYTDSRDKQQYKTIKIGNQVWMAENLKSTRYNDRTAIPMVKDNTAWSKLKTPAFCWPDIGGSKEPDNKEIYGALYNWYSVNTGKLCPIGWHVPALDEWTLMITYLGGESAARGKLLESGKTHWVSPDWVNSNGVTNESNFTALPAGNRSSNGAFDKIGYNCYWWSSTESGTTSAWCLFSWFHDSIVNRGITSKQGGFSVRCLRDK